MERDGLHAFEIWKSKLVLGVFIALLCLGGVTEQKAVSCPRFCFLPPRTLFGGQIIILRVFMMYNKDTVWANIGMHYLAINALLDRCWHHFAHSSSEFGS